MKSIWYSRRTFIACLGILCLMVLGFRGEEVGFHIVGIVLGIVGANAAEGAITSQRQAAIQDPILPANKSRSRK